MQYKDQKTETMKKIEQNLKEMWDTITHINIHIMRIPKQFLKRRKEKKIFEEIMSEIFLNLMENVT